MRYNRTQKKLDKIPIGTTKIFKDKIFAFKWRLLRKRKHREYDLLHCTRTKKELKEYIKKENIKCN